MILLVTVLATAHPPMPEGHTIHRVAKDHCRAFAGQMLRVASPQGRFADEADVLNRRKLLNVEAWGKHLFYTWTAGRVVHVHLGLYGRFRRHPTPPPDPVGQVRMRVIGRSQSFDLVGPNRCRLIGEPERQEVIRRLGPDPLRRDAEPQQFMDRVRRSRKPIAAILLDQSTISGIGNVYRAEILFLLGIHPSTPGEDVADEDLDRIWQESVRLLNLGVRYNRIITADPERFGKPLGRLRKSERLCIYKRPRCSLCGESTSRAQIGNRTCYYCSNCQTK